MSNSNIIDGTAYQSGIGPTLSLEIRNSISAVISRYNNLKRAPSEYQARYVGLVNRNAQATARIVAERQSQIGQDWNLANSEVKIDSFGVPYRVDGSVMVVLAEKYEWRPIGIGGKAGQPQENKIGSFAEYDGFYNRIVIAPWFAQALWEGDVRYLGADGGWHEYTLADVIHHEYGHAADSVFGGGSEADGLVNQSAEKMEEIWGLAGGKAPRLDHATLQFRDLNGNWISSEGFYSQTSPDFEAAQAIVSYYNEMLNLPDEPFLLDSTSDNYNPSKGQYLYLNNGSSVSLSGHGNIVSGANLNITLDYDSSVFIEEGSAELSIGGIIFQVGAISSSTNSSGMYDSLTIPRGVVVTVSPQGDIEAQSYDFKTISYDPRSKNAVYQVTGQDEFGRSVKQVYTANLANNTFDFTGDKTVVDGALTIEQHPNSGTTIRLTNSPINIDFVDAAETIASTLGRYIAGDDILTETVVSAVLNTVASNFGDVLNTLAFDTGTATADNLAHAFDGIDAELLNNLQSAGVGAISSFLSAQLIDALGVNGIPGELLNTAAGQTINVMITNLTNGEYVFKDLSTTSIANAAGSFVGNKLASEIANWDEVGEQIGAQIGGALGAAIGTGIPFIGTAIGAFFGNLIGGLIGGVFTGAPRSGAILGYDETTGQFRVETVWKEDGGKRAVARQLGNTAATSLNGILATIGGELLNGDDVEAGSYGMRKKAFVYWNDGTSSDNRIKFSTASDLVEYGVMKAAQQMEIIGGDIYSKRAFYLTMARGAVTSSNGDGATADDGKSSNNVDFGLDLLLGNFAVADRLKVYLANSASINALIAAEPDSVFTTDWLIALASASELGLLKRNEHDWDGGFSYLLDRGNVDARNVGLRFETSSREGNGERVMYLDGAALEDTIDTGSKTIVQGGVSDDVLTAYAGGARDGAPAGTAYHIANVFHGGDGDDRIVAGDTGDDLFGDSGNDLLVGGKLDDWLFGGAGNDVLDAGGGSGNVLIAGEGDDQLVGSNGISADPINSGSDWLLGDLGNDRLYGLGGDDYFEGGQGSDFIEGGRGSDTIIFRAGDGTDRISDIGVDQDDVDVIQFGDGISTNEVGVIASSSSIDISMLLGAGGDRIDLRGAALTSRAGIEFFDFGSTIWSRGQVTARAVFAKNAGTIVSGTGLGEIVDGTRYDDTLSGGSGDTLKGGYGSEAYQFALGDGEVTIDESGFGSDLDVVHFAAGIAVADISVIINPASPQDLIVQVGSAGDRLILKHQRIDASEGSLEEFRFANGTSLSLRDLYGMALAGGFTANADVKMGLDQPDRFLSGNGNDRLTGGLGNDNLEGQGGSDTYVYRIGDGFDRIYDPTTDAWNASLGSNTLELGAGITTSNITMERDPSDNNNVRIGIAGQVGSILIDGQYDLATYNGNTYWGITNITFADGTVWNRAAIDSFLVQSGLSQRNDIVTGTRADESIDGGAGNDRIGGNDGADTITGGIGDDSLDGGSGADIYIYNLGDGFDRIWDATTDAWNAAIGDNTLKLGAGITAADVILERDQADTNNLRVRFANGVGSVLIDGQYQLATYNGSTYWGITNIAFADGTVWNRAQIEAQLKQASISSLNDVIYGIRSDDVLDGGSGNDRIYANEGSDTLTGGAGDDILEGGSGADTYIYNLGDGFDRIWDATTDAWNGGIGDNTLKLGAGITTADVILERDQADTNNVRVRFANGVGSVLIDGQYQLSTYNGSTYWGITNIAFADGTIWNRATIEAQLLASSQSVQNDVVYGTRTNETINGGAGNDTIFSGDGNDVISGGMGNDVLQGGNGQDTYIYNLGDGDDVIIDLSRDAYNNWFGANTLRFGAGISSSDLIIEKDFSDNANMVIRFANAAGSITVDDQTRAYWTASWGIDTFEFADGTTWDRAAITAAITTSSAVLSGTNAADNLTGTVAAETIRGLAGNDTLTGGAGTDRLEGGDGNDTYLFNLGDGFDLIVDSSGSDTVRFGTGITTSSLILSQVKYDGDNDGVFIAIAGTSDRLRIFSQNSSNRIEKFEFADGTIWTEADLRTQLFAQVLTVGDDIVRGTGFGDTLLGGAGDDQIQAVDGDDVLGGGTGSDRLEGGNGNDTYLFNLGDGFDVIVETGGTDTVRFGAGISTSHLILTQVNQDGDNDGVFITVSGTNDRLHIVGQNAGNYRIERFEFADGTVWTDADFRTQLFAQLQTAGDDLIRGTGFVDVLSGGSGDDLLYGLDGNDTLGGGTGSDRLEGGNGDDVYLFNLGDGFDVIAETGGTDTVRFGAGISASDLILTQVNQDGDNDGVFITISGTNDRLHIIGQNTGNYTVERFEFADGTVLTSTQLRERLFAQISTGGDDVIRGSGVADILDGQGGDDQIYGLDGNDTLTGGKGSDRLEGGNGNDIYLFNRGDGGDTIWDSGGSDTIRFGPGIAPGDLEFTQAIQDGDNNGVTLAIKGTNDRLHIIGQAGGSLIERFEFFDGTVWTAQTLIDVRTSNSIGGQQVAVTMGDDMIVGTSGADTIRGMGGDDALRGGMGSDTYKFARGDGFDTIYDPDEAAATDVLVLEGINSTDVTVMVSPTDPDDIVLYIDDQSIIYLDQNRTGAKTGVDEIRFADGAIWDRATLLAKASNGQGTAANNLIIGSNFADSLAGGAGDDRLVGGAGDDVYAYNVGDGNDVIVDVADNADPAATTGNVLSFGPGITLADIRVSRNMADGPLIISFAGQSGSVTLEGSQSDSLAGVQFLKFSDGSVHSMADVRQAALTGQATSGNDLIEGFSTADTLSGGAGNDTLIGRSGADTYHFELGDDEDTIIESDGAANKLVFGTGIATSSLRLYRTIDAPDDLIIALPNGTDRVVLKDQLASSGRSGVAKITFADGTAWDRAEIIEQLLSQPATPYADYLVGSDTADIIDGLAGNDYIEGGRGNDILSGSDGNDILFGGIGNDALYGGDGDDILSGDEGLDTLDGGNGFDTADYSFSLDSWNINLAAGTATIIQANGTAPAEALNSIEAVKGGLGSDHITGDDSANRIQGGAGNDTLQGAGGDDVFVVEGDEEGVDAVDGGAGYDRIEAAADDTVIGLASLSGVELITANGHANVRIETTDENDALDLSGVELQGIVSVVMGAGDDVITGSAQADTINAGIGNDVIRFIGDTAGADAIDGGDGADRIEAGAASTVIRLASLQNVETISGNGFANVVVKRTDASETTDFTNVTLTGISRIELGAGNDTFLGSAQADIVVGGVGNDTLTGNNGDDQFLYAGTDGGFDIVNGGAGNDKILATASGTIIGLQSFTAVEVIDGGGYSNVDIQLTDNNDTISFASTSLVGIRSINGGAGDDNITGSNGNDTIVGGAGSDTINGNGGIDTVDYSYGAANQTIDLNNAGFQTISAGDVDKITNVENVIGGTGNDSIIGNGGANMIWGGLGNDTLDGGAGNDSLFGEDGDDLLKGGAGTDTINGGAGIDTLDYSAYTANLTVTLASTAAQTVASGDSDTISNIENLIGGSGADTLTGSSEANVLDGGSGNDRLTGGAGDDTIIGGVGTSDVAVFAGLQSSYTIATNAGVVTITDNDASADGNDGVDTVSGIEKAEFKGGVQVGIAAPIVLDLNGDGVTLVDNRRTNVSFDWDGDGTREQTGWVGRDDGFLFFDRDGNGTVTNAGELSFTSDKDGAKSDLDGLRSFDSNEDGIFSSADDQFAQFMIWQDRNGNGRTEENEIVSLQAAGIASIDLAGEAVNRGWEWGENITVNTGSFVRTNGTVGAFSDVALSYEAGNARNAAITKAASQLSEAIAGFWGKRGTAEFGKFEAWAERRDHLLAAVRGE